MDRYTSLVVDMENSRRYDLNERNIIQNYMIELTDKLNKVFESFLQFEMTFSAGDELQGLFTDTTAAVLYLRLLSIFAKPLKLRAGIGVGEWNVRIGGGVSTQQDGPAYHRARKAIIEVKKKQLHHYMLISDEEVDLMNSLLNASMQLQAEQAQKQNLTLAIMELIYPFQKQEKLDFSKELVTQLLKIKIQYNEAMDYATEFFKDTIVDFRKNVDIIESIEIDGQNFDSEKAIVKTKMSSNIALLLGSKRQNADKLIKRGHAFVIRSLDYTALQFIERNFYHG